RPEWGGRAAARASIPLEVLPEDAAAQLCRALLKPAHDVPAAALTRLSARARGVPLLLTELVRGLKREGLLRRRAKGVSYYLATDELDRLPDLPLYGWLAGRELAALDPALAAHARLAAVLAPEFTNADQAAVLSELDRAGEGAEFPLDGAVAVGRLCASGFLL